MAVDGDNGVIAGCITGLVGRVTCMHVIYPRVYLDSFEGFEAACRLYQRAGFRLVMQQPEVQWGSRVNEQRHEVER